MANNEKLITIGMSEKLFKRLEIYVSATERSKAWVGRKALEAYLDLQVGNASKKEDS